MTTDKCLPHGKVTETNLVKRDRNLKFVKCQWEEMIHIKIDCAKKHQKIKLMLKKKDINEKKMQKREI